MHSVLAQLIPLEGGTPITIDKDVTVVGRQSEHCDVVLKRKSVSKIHCVIVRTDGLLFVRDLSSTNGTKVNGQRIVRGALLPGDQLSLGGEKYRVHLGPAAAAVTPHDRTEAMPVFDKPRQAESFSGDVEAVDDRDSPMRSDDLVE
ncbi:MAG: FHA domain-containing protein [Planctomycetaceae bacterium]